MSQFELLASSPELHAGVDEAGRGPLAGPVVAAAVILDPNRPIAGLNDSKKLTPASRERLAISIESDALAWSVAYASVEEIDDINILQASLLAMQRAISQLSMLPSLALIDGNKVPKLDIPSEAIIGGDATVPAISAASILAKVSRDQYMKDLELQYPGYGFAQHKGYGTKGHVQALKTLGPCIVHRRSFQPVKSMLTSHSEISA